MIPNNEILGLLILFLIIYFIIYIDHKLHIKCNCDNCYLTSQNISIKIPLLLTFISALIYKYTKSYINSFIYCNSINKQNIITDMADF